MNIAIVDADLIGRKNHRFPNLACEKISAYWKQKGAAVTLLTDYDSINTYDEVYISKVFTDTVVPDHLKNHAHVHMGGTGFYYDKAPKLPEAVEHIMPDYHLYDDVICSIKGNTKDYTTAAIGFLTRGCFRQCAYCVNQNYKEVYRHSPLDEFNADDRRRIVCLDDNFLGYKGWKPLLQQLLDQPKPFHFKQGLDERLLTDEKCEMLFSARYDGDFTFAFDRIQDYDLIKEKIKMIRRHTNRQIRFYVLCGFEGTDVQDIANTFKRIRLLQQYRMLPYIMRFQSACEKPYQQSRWHILYNQLARWCNQPNVFKKTTFREFCQIMQDQIKTPGRASKIWKTFTEFEKEYPSLAAQYFDVCWGV